MDQKQIAELKRDMDKEVIDAIRHCIMADEKEKVFDFMDMLHFSKSLAIVQQLCEKLKQPDMAKKVKKFLDDKQTKEVFMKQVPQDGRQNGGALNLQSQRTQA